MKRSGPLPKGIGVVTVGLFLSLGTLACGFGGGIKNWPTMAELAEKAPEFKDAAPVVNAELRLRHRDPARMLPEIYHKRDGHLVFHLHDFGSGPDPCGVDVEFSPTERRVLSVTDWAGRWTFTDPAHGQGKEAM